MQPSTKQNEAVPSFALSHDEWGQLVLTDANGTSHVGVEAVRAFPLTSRTEAIALCDAVGRELIWIDSLGDLPTALRKVLEESLANRDFIPMIGRIVSVSDRGSPTKWEVETDRGRTQFLVDGEGTVRSLSTGGVLITDVLGIRYLIPDARQLDAASRRFLEQQL